MSNLTAVIHVQPGTKNRKNLAQDPMKATLNVTVKLKKQKSIVTDAVANTLLTDYIHIFIK